MRAFLFACHEKRGQIAPTPVRGLLRNSVLPKGFCGFGLGGQRIKTDIAQLMRGKSRQSVAAATAELPDCKDLYKNPKASRTKLCSGKSRDI